MIPVLYSHCFAALKSIEYSKLADQNSTKNQPALNRCFPMWAHLVGGFNPSAKNINLYGWNKNISSHHLYSHVNILSVLDFSTFLQIILSPNASVKILAFSCARKAMLHHLGWIKSCDAWDIYSSSGAKISPYKMIYLSWHDMEWIQMKREGFSRQVTYSRRCSKRAGSNLIRLGRQKGWDHDYVYQVHLATCQQWTFVKLEFLIWLFEYLSLTWTFVKNIYNYDYTKLHN